MWILLWWRSVPPWSRRWLPTPGSRPAPAWSPCCDGCVRPSRLRPSKDRIRPFYNEIRFHQGIGYVTPQDEHTGRGAAIRAARKTGLAAAQEARVATRRQLRQITHEPPPVAGYTDGQLVHFL
jgi:hypothetical protein